MRVSVYTIYVLACLLAIVAAILSGVVLLNTFHSQQKATEDAQLNTGLGQVTSMQTMIATQMARLQTTTDSKSRQLLMEFNALSDADLSPQNSVNSLNGTIWNSWVPDEKAPNSLNGVGVTLLYTDPATGRMFDRTFWVYWDLYKSGEYVYAYTYGNATDNMTYCYVTQWPNYSTPQLGAFMYKMNATALTLSTYENDDFFNSALPWSTDDGSSYWYFTHLRAFHTRGMWVVVKAWDVGTNWLGMMKSVQTPGAELIAFDSRGYVMAATNPAELQRLDECRGAIGVDDVDGGVAADCINTNARSHPVAEIRDVYTALHQPVWDALTAGVMTATPGELTLYGRRYQAISATLFTNDLLQVIIVWYAPWAVIQGNIVSLTALICVLTLLSTFVLTLLGVFGVLRPLMAVGRAMRAVARTLKQGDGESETVLEKRRSNLFREVDEIGKDFETIVVDFLGFSNTNARDNKCAPRDTDKPFAVVFTDVQASTRLWGKNPVEMSRCMQAHHELIRGLVKEHGLYEVKTVGDSFMVTTASPQAALRFALDVQTTFYDYDWDWEAADEHYQEVTLAFVKAHSAEQDYRKLWNGLRVRVGIHYGLGDVTYDEVSKGYDYYGTVVNVAARIETVAHGGQIVVSQDLMDALPAPLDPALGRATKLGVFPLRGVVDPPVLVEVKPTRLRGRTFPPLRVEEYLDDTVKMEGSSDAHSYLSEGPAPGAGDRNTGGGDATSHASSASHVSERRVAQAAEECARSHALVRGGLAPVETVAHQLQALYHILEALLKPLGPQQQSTVTKALTKGWGVAPPKSKAESYISGMRLVQRLSETTKVLGHLALRPAAPQRALRHDDAADMDDVV